MIFAATFLTIFIAPCTTRPTDKDELKIWEDNGGDPNWLMLLPNVLLGIGYSVYAAALWGCVPYTVQPRLVASAFGLCTAI